MQSNPSDKQYMVHLVALGRQYLGNNVVLYTTDGGSLSYMQRGSLPGSAVYTVGDFGPGSNPQPSFEASRRRDIFIAVEINLLLQTHQPHHIVILQAQKQMNAPGMSPNMCSEFYSGWLTHCI